MELRRRFIQYIDMLLHINKVFRGTRLARLVLIMVAVSLAGRAGPGTAASGWSPVGPDGGHILALAESRLNPGLLYALAFNVQGQVFRSLNGGASWRRMAWIRDFVYDLVCDPRRPDTVYVLWMNGVYKSYDRGSTWTKHALPSPHYSFGRIAVSPKNSSVVYATGIAVTSPSTWTTCMAVFKSNTGGQTWSVKRIIPGSAAGQARALAVDPVHPNILYVGGWYTTDAYRDGLFKSSDGGSTWKDITGTIVDEPRAIVVDPANSSRLYVGTTAGVYASADGGKTWTKGKGLAAATVLAFAPSDSNVLYAGNGTAIARSRYAGANWTVLTHSAYGSVACLSPSPGRLLYGASGGLYKSADGGTTWASSHKGIRAAMMGAPAISAAAPGTLYAVVPAMGLMKSVDARTRWSKLPDFERSRSVLRIVLHATNQKILYALGSGTVISSAATADPLPSIYKTVNGGTSWTKVLTAAVADLELSRTNPARVFAAGTSGTGANEVMALYKSSDGGKTWTTYTAYAAGNTRLYELAVDPSNDRVLYIGGDRGIYTKLFLKSIDGGLTWTNLSSSLPGIPIGRLVFDPSNTQRLYNVHSAGTYRSEDGGLSWTRLDMGDFQAEDMVIDPADPNVFFAAGSAGVRMSADGGATWTDITGSLPIKNVLGLALDPVGRTLYAGTNGASLYKRAL